MQRKLWPGWLVLGTAAAVVVLDQLSKRWIERNLPLYDSIIPIAALQNFFTFTHFTNTGAAFGLFRDQGILFIVIAAVVVVAIFIYSRYLPMDQWLVRFALGLQLGGALGNLIDRVRQGHVTDFIYFHFWPAFNVADAAIVVGVGLLALALILQKEPQPQDAGGETGEQPSV